MANSIDDMLKNQIPRKKKSGAKVVFLLLILLVLIGAAGAAAYWYLSNQNKVTPKQYFLQYLGKSVNTQALNFEKMEAFANRFAEEPTEVETKASATLSPGMLDTGEIDISEMELAIESKNDPTKEKSESDIVLNYKGNEIITLNALMNKDRIGIYSEEVITKYLGTKISNLADIIGKITGQDINLPVDISEIKNIEIVFPHFSENMFVKYGDIISQKVPEEAFTSKPITLDRSAGKTDVTEFTMKLKESQAIEVLGLVLQTLENDDELLDMLLASTGDKAELLKGYINSKIEMFINSMYENTPDDTRIYTMKVYGANNNLYKISLDINEMYMLDIDFNYGQNMSSIEITALEMENQKGISIDIQKTITDVTEKADITVSVVSDSEIVGKLNIVSDLVSSGNSYTLKNNLDVNFMTFVAGIQTSSNITFKQVQTKDLTEDNCVFLDELNEDTFKDIVEAVTNKVQEVMNEKFISQGAKKVEEEVPDQTPATINTDAVKQISKTKLINAISAAMTEAQNEGRTYSLIDLTSLEIPGSTFSVSLDGDIAVLNIDGFEFKLNSDFQLYE